MKIANRSELIALMFALFTTHSYSGDIRGRKVSLTYIGESVGKTPMKITIVEYMPKKV